MGIAGNNGRNRFADEANFLVGQDRLIVERGAMIRGSGRIFITSSIVATRNTPGNFRAALVPIDLIMPCATVLRKSLATSIPGSRIVSTYSARPVTLSRPSSRGTERPICEPTVV